MVTATIIGYFEGRDTKETFYNLGIFIMVAFITELLKSFGEIMVIGDWMASLIRC